MKQRRLGRSGLVVSEICLGTMTFGNQADERTSRAILDRAFDAGVDFLDVAEIYPVPPDVEVRGPQRGDRRPLARRQAARRVCSSPPRSPAPAAAGSVAAGARQPHRRSTAITSSAPSRPACGASAPTTSTSTRRTGPTAACRSRRRSRRSTASSRRARCATSAAATRPPTASPRACGRATAPGSARYETIQNNFSLLNRRFEDELAEVCRREQVSLLPYSPIAGGVLSGKYQDGARPGGRALQHLREGHAAHPGDDAPLRQREDARVDRALHAHRPRGRHAGRDARHRLDAGARLRRLDDHRRDRTRTAHRHARRFRHDPVRRTSWPPATR